MIDYGVCQKYLDRHDQFKEPRPRCPECCRIYPKYENRVEYIADYVTHRIGYHGTSPYEVKRDLERILECEVHDCDCCCKDDKNRSIIYYLNRLDVDLEDVKYSVNRLRERLQI